ncbi:hypothetical protein IJV79_00085, partial [bacterium]|nr:hypothetical protein [bacterium]
VIFSNSSKEEMATLFYIAIEDRNIRIDSNISQKVIQDWHSIRKFTTKSGNTRLEGSEDGRHADNFWSSALAIYAASTVAEFKNTRIITGALPKLKINPMTGDMRGLKF